MADPSPSPPPLIHHMTLHAPHPNTRTWSSAAHPSARTPLLATAASDKSVHVWDMRDWKLVSTIAGGHKRSVRCVGWKDFGAPSKRRKGPEAESEKEKEREVLLATGSFDSNCGLWVWNREQNALGEQQGGGGGAVAPSEERGGNNIPGAFGEDEQDFTMSGRANEEEEEEAEEWHFSTLLTGPDSEIKDLAFSPPHYGANLLATCSRDKSVWVWEEVEPEEWETVAVLGEHAGDVKCVSWLKGAQTTRRELRERLRRRRRVEASVEAEQKVGTENGQDAGGEEDDEDIILGGRELLASGAYDDTIRLHHDDEAEGDWLTIAVMTGHDGTVWDLKFEPFVNLAPFPSDTTVDEVIAEWEPRLISCSDDLTVRLWRKQLNEKEREEKRIRIADARRGKSSDAPGTGPGGNTMQTGFAGSLIPSVIRPLTSTEKWIEEAKLPSVHVRSVYAVDWSTQTGLVVSCGGDGIIAIYREVVSPASAEMSGDVVMNGTDEHQNGAPEDGEGGIKKMKTEWKVVALMEAAHDEYEINHVCWAPRRDLRRRQVGFETDGEEGEEDDEEEYIISTGDDGQIRVWRVPKEVLDAVRSEQ